MRLRCSLPAIIAGLIIALSCPAGLSDFEKSATKKSRSSNHHSSSGHHADNDDGDSSLGDLIFDIFLGGQHDDDDSSCRYEGSANSLDRTDSFSMDENRLMRSVGDPLLPIIRVDTTFLHENSDIDAYDVRLEAGYGALAISVRNTYWLEEDPDDYLNVLQWHLLRRFAIDEQLTISAGIGAISLEGDEVNTGRSFTMPIQFQPSDSFGIEYRPTWSSVNNNALTEHDVGILLRKDQFSLRLGHRWFYTETEMLQGPYIGFAWHF